MKKRLTAFVLTLSLLIVLLTGCFSTEKNSEKYEKTQQVFDALDTIITVTLYGDPKDNAELIAESRALCNALELVFSPTDTESELYQINQKPAGSYNISEDLATVVERGLYFAQLSEGAFDPTIGAVSTLWNFKKDSPQMPPTEAIAEALPHVDYRKISLEGTRYTKVEDEVKLDLGAIAKGYIGDRLQKFFIEKQVPYGLISLGGDVISFGQKPDASPWVIGIGNPLLEENPEAPRHIGRLTIDTGAAVTSGNYQRYFDLDGKRYHHILDPATGYPVENNLLSVTIWAADGMDADALSTICYVLGPEKGLAFLENNSLGKAVYYTKEREFLVSDNFPEFKKAKGV